MGKVAGSVKFAEREVIGINWRLLLYCLVPMFMNLRVFNEAFYKCIHYVPFSGMLIF